MDTSCTRRLRSARWSPSRRPTGSCCRRPTAASCSSWATGARGRTTASSPWGSGTAGAKGWSPGARWARAHWNLPAERLEPPELEDEDAEEAWQIALERDYWDVALIGGAFPIAHQGCAVRDLLVVTGPRRGHIWVDERASYEGIRPEFTGDGGPLAFEGWYLRWLDEAAQAVGS